MKVLLRNLYIEMMPAAGKFVIKVVIRSKLTVVIIRCFGKS